MRKTKDVTISQEGRDDGKVFRVTEMPAFQAERWATRATLALLPRLTREVSPEIAEELKANPGMLPLERVGLLLGSISFPETGELMEEIFSACVQVVTDPARGLVRSIGVGGAEDIEEVETIAFLRAEALALHTNFTLAAGILNLISAVSRTSPFGTTPTSPELSVPSSRPARPPSTNSRQPTPSRT
jgi:hypothetical protein